MATRRIAYFCSRLHRRRRSEPAGTSALAIAPSPAPVQIPVFAPRAITPDQTDLPVIAVATGRADVLQGLLEISELVPLTETIPLLPMPLDRDPDRPFWPPAVRVLAQARSMDRSKAVLGGAYVVGQIGYRTFSAISRTRRARNVGEPFIARVPLFAHSTRLASIR